MDSELMEAVLGTYSRLIDDIQSLRELIISERRSRHKAVAEEDECTEHPYPGPPLKNINKSMHLHSDNACGYGKCPAYGSTRNAVHRVQDVGKEEKGAFSRDRAVKERGRKRLAQSVHRGAVSAPKGARQLTMAGHSSAAAKCFLGRSVVELDGPRLAHAEEELGGPSGKQSRAAGLVQVLSGYDAGLLEASAYKATTTGEQEYLRSIVQASKKRTGLDISQSYSKAGGHMPIPPAKRPSRKRGTPMRSAKAPIPRQSRPSKSDFFKALELEL